METCYLVVSLFLYLYTLFFPALHTSPPPPFCLLQAAKWILLSQSHQGKSRKRKKREPKVNYKEVGDTGVYYDFYLHRFLSRLNSRRYTFSILETSHLSYLQDFLSSHKLAVIVFCFSVNKILPGSVYVVSARIDYPYLFKSVFTLCPPPTYLTS